MKNILYILAVTMLFTVSSCKKYTDITPKGRNLLNRASDLDLLLNVTYSGNGFNFRPQSTLINDTYGQIGNVTNIISSNVMTINKVMLTFDESVDRAALTLTDGPYDDLYGHITKIANIVLFKADEATGDAALLNRLKAESYILRAYFHFLLVNTYAKAYDPATAATDGGVPYVNTINFEELNKKNTVKEVYDNLLLDIDAALKLDALPDQPVNSQRVGKAFAYGVKARVLLSMRDYAGALEAVNTGLTYNSVLEDHRPFLAIPKATRGAISRIGTTAPDNLFYTYYSKLGPFAFFPSAEVLANVYEPGNILKDSTTTYDYAQGPLYSGLAGVPIFFSFAYEANGGGMTTSDLYLMRAECLIRTNKVADGMDDINRIRIRRIAPYAPLTATTEAEGMVHLKRTARIEYLYTWKNFVDIKRWNREGKYPQIIDKTINGVKYTLSPNSPLWVFPFPQSGTQFNPTLTQNY